MSKKWLIRSVIAVPMMLAGTVANAVTVSLHSSNAGIDSINVNIVGTTITIEEFWTTSAQGMLLIDGLEDGTDYTVRKIIHNNTVDNWTSFANELLDPFGIGVPSGEDDDFDPMPYPGFVPAGFSTSNDQDGLSYAQGSGLPRTSTIFPSLIVDEFSDARDFLDFFGATFASGATDNFMTFGLRDNNGVGDLDCTGDDFESGCPNQPFILAQRPNAFSQPPAVPEPTTLGLFGMALAGLGLTRRRRST